MQSKKSNERWIELYFPYKRGISQARKEFKKLIKKYNPINYHWLYEGEFTVFRLEFKRLPKHFKCWKKFSVKRDYIGEEHNFKKLWIPWKKMMTQACDVFFLTNYRSEEEKFLGKVFHCILNQAGYEADDELHLYNKFASGRMFMWIMYNIKDLQNIDTDYFNEQMSLTRIFHEISGSDKMAERKTCERKI